VVFGLCQQDATSHTDTERELEELLVSPDFQNSNNQLLQFAKISLTEKEAVIRRKILVVNQEFKIREETNGRRTSPEAPATLQIPYSESSTREILDSLEVPIEKLVFFDLKQRELEIEKVRQLVKANPYVIVTISPSRFKKSLVNFFKNDTLCVGIPKDLTTRENIDETTNN
jgi:hypothetical protein